MALGVASLAGCIAGMGYTTRDRVTAAAREYNEGVRWGRLEQAAAHLERARRAGFVDRHKALEDELEIADYELVSLELDKSDKKLPRATARVEYTWSLKRRGLVEKTSTDQRWEERDGEWLLAAEVRVKGAPLSLFDEPPRPPRGPASAAE
jgi:hypothetical protein